MTKYRWRVAQLDDYDLPIANSANGGWCTTLKDAQHWSSAYRRSREDAGQRVLVTIDEIDD